MFPNPKRHLLGKRCCDDSELICITFRLGVRAEIQTSVEVVLVSW